MGSKKEGEGNATVASRTTGGRHDRSDCRGLAHNLTVWWILAVPNARKSSAEMHRHLAALEQQFKELRVRLDQNSLDHHLVSKRLKVHAEYLLQDGKKRFVGRVPKLIKSLSVLRGHYRP